MRYPTIPTTLVSELVPVLRDGDHAHLDEVIELVGHGQDLDLVTLDELIPTLEDELELFRNSEDAGDKDLFEGRVAGRIHAALADVPVAILDDPRFWCYLALAKFWWFLIWREPQGMANPDPKGFKPYTDGGSAPECIPLRLFLRGQIALREGSYDLSSAVPEATDFWRSHVVRVDTGKNPALARALVQSQADDRMITGRLRRFASLLNLRRTGLLLHLHTDDEAAALIEELRAE